MVKEVRLSIKYGFNLQGQAKAIIIIIEGEGAISLVYDLENAKVIRDNLVSAINYLEKGTFAPDDVATYLCNACGSQWEDPSKPCPKCFNAQGTN